MNGSFEISSLGQTDEIYDETKQNGSLSRSHTSDNEKIVTASSSDRSSKDQFHMDGDQSTQTEESSDGDIDRSRMKDALPVTIMLRNCLPPNVCSASSERDQKDRGGDRGANTRSIDRIRIDPAGNENIDEEPSMDDDDDYVEEDENDTTLDNYQIFTKTNQWRDQAKNIIFLPIEIEIVVTYDFLLQFHSHQKHEHTRARIRDLFGLDINIEKNDKNKDSKDSLETRNEPIVVLCSKLQDTRSSHPLWDHVNEKLDDLYDILPKELDLWNDLYKAMRIQFRAIVTSKANFDLRGKSSQNNVSADNINCKESKSILLASCPLHPYKLKPLALSKYGRNQNDTSSPLLVGSSKFRDEIPKLLPPNSILIHYSDGTTRVSPELYHLLGHKNLIEIESSSDQLRLENIDVDKFARRFDDDVFDVLEDEGYVKAKFNPQVERALPQNHTDTRGSNSKMDTTASMTVKIQDLETAVGTLDAFSQAMNQQTNQQTNRPISRGAFAAAFDSMKNGTDSKIAFKLDSGDPKDKKITKSEEEELSSNHSTKGTVVKGDKGGVRENGQHCSKERLSDTNRSTASLEMQHQIEVLESEIKQLEQTVFEEESILQESTEYDQQVRHAMKLYH